MNNTAVVCKLKNVRAHPNADKVQLATACGYQVVVGLDRKEGDLGVYFPVDTCLGSGFAELNPDLLTYFGKNLRVRVQKFRGEISEGFWAPISTLPFNVKDGDELLEIDGFEVCKKYVNPNTLRQRQQNTNLPKRLRAGALPTFQKHVDTLHLRKEWDSIPRDRPWIWTVKEHGSSARVGYTLVQKDLTWWEKFLKKIGVSVQETEYKYLIGTRNVIIGATKSDGTLYKDIWYSDEFRRRAAAPFVGNLHKGEVVYYEIVGYAGYNNPIMAQHTADKKTPEGKEIIKLYGEYPITYTYGCANGQLDIYVYRIAYQTEDGVSVDLTWDQVKKRCDELGVKYVPEFDPGITLEQIAQSIERTDPICPSHPMEGVVLRVEGSTPLFYKEKSFTFKVLEGLVKDSGAVDLEDAS